MSSFQYGTLKYISTHDINVEYVRMFNQTTFGSLWQHGWVIRVHKKIVLTKEGERALELYSKALPNYRKHLSSLSPRVAIMLELKLEVAS